MYDSDDNPFRTALRNYVAEKKLDPVSKADDDIDNDGDEDESDAYLKNRREKISKAIEKRKKEKNEEKHSDEEEEEPKGKKKVVIDDKPKIDNGRMESFLRMKNGGQLNEATSKDEGRQPKPDENDDEGSANIQMQLRKSISLRGQKDVKFNDGNTVKVSMAMAQAVLGKLDAIQRPMDRQAVVMKIMSSYEELKKFASE
jgi:hypothetical protein